MADATAVFTAGQRLTKADSTPVGGGYAKFFEVGSDDEKEVFADADLSISLGATVYTDTGGYPVTTENGTTKTLVYTNTDPYKIVGYDENDVVIWSHDNVKGAVIASGSEEEDGITQDEADLRYNRYANALSNAPTIEDGDKFTGYDTSAAGNAAFPWSLFKSVLQSTWQASGILIPSGTRAAWQQATPPVGWTKESNAAYNDAIIKFTTGGSVGTGGTQTFANVFKSWTPSGSVGNDTPSLSKTASHDHGGSGGVKVGTNTLSFAGGGSNSTPTASADLPSQGSGNSHNHAFSGDAQNFSAKYAEFTIGQKS